MALRAALFLALLAPSFAHAAGMAFNENFVVYTPDQATEAAEEKYAETVLNRAEAFRQEFQRHWLDAPLPNGSGKTTIYVTFSESEDRGLTWAKDHPGRIYHNIYLTTSPELAAGSTLRHEVVHSVLATRWPHPNRLPEWVEEGIASRFDDANRKALRAECYSRWRQSGQVPRLVVLLETEDVKSLDETSYAAATSLVDYLLTLGDETTVLRFAESGQRRGWAAALQEHYGIQSLDELQSQWQAWITESCTDG